MYATELGLFSWLLVAVQVVFLVQLPLCHATIYYVRPEGGPGDDLCPRPCHTLSEYQTMSTNHSLFTYTGPAHPDLVLVFLPGEHVLDGDLTVSGASSFTMTVSGQTNSSAVIVAKEHILARSVENISFTGLTFTTHNKARENKDYLFCPKSFSFLTICNCTVTKFWGYFVYIASLETASVKIQYTTITSTTVPPVEIGIGTSLFSDNGFVFHFSNIANLLLERNTITQNNITFNGLLSIIGITVVEMRDNAIHDNHGTECYFPVLRTASSTVNLYGTNTFTRNQNLVWLVFFSTTVNLNGRVEFSSNHACGGPLTVQYNSCLVFYGNVSFVNNTSTGYGGAIVFSEGSSMSIVENSSVLFQSNTAHTRGGAVYVEDPISCDSEWIISDACFIQVSESASNFSLLFLDNTAVIAGDDVYGGQLFSCLQPSLEGFETCLPEPTQYLKHPADILIPASRVHSTPTLSSVSSHPTQLCLCSADAIACCASDNAQRYSLDSEYIEVCPFAHDLGQLYPGQNMTIKVVGVGQYFGAAPVDIRAFTGIVATQYRQIPLAFEGIGITPILASINATCTAITYRPIYSRNITVSYFSLVPDRVCTRQAPLVMRVNFSSNCPPGFEMSEQTDMCSCEKRLQELNAVSCDINTQTVQHSGNVWVGYYNKSDSTSGLITHSVSCPLDYCIKYRNVSFSLANPDEQCIFNRSGLICGQCAEGLSVVLGGFSHCQKCSNAYLSLLIVFALAGIALIALLFLLHFTVKSGTLSGLIFYANIV